MRTANQGSDAVSDGPLEWALNIVGDRWSLLVVSAIGRGTQRFNDIQRQTGMPRDQLAQRLRRLESRSVICRHLYCDHPPRYEYALTYAGRSLTPTLAALASWGATYAGSRNRA